MFKIVLIFLIFHGYKYLPTISTRHPPSVDFGSKDLDLYQRQNVCEWMKTIKIAEPRVEVIYNYLYI